MLIVASIIFRPEVTGKILQVGSHCYIIIYLGLIEIWTRVASIENKA
jgi:hypothetical protein